MDASRWYALGKRDNMLGLPKGGMGLQLLLAETAVGGPGTSLVQLEAYPTHCAGVFLLLPPPQLRVVVVEKRLA